MAVSVAIQHAGSGFGFVGDFEMHLVNEGKLRFHVTLAEFLTQRFFCLLLDFFFCILSVASFFFFNVTTQG